MSHPKNACQGCGTTLVQTHEAMSRLCHRHQLKLRSLHSFVAMASVHDGPHDFLETVSVKSALDLAERVARR